VCAKNERLADAVERSIYSLQQGFSIPVAEATTSGQRQEQEKSSSMQLSSAQEA